MLRLVFTAQERNRLQLERLQSRPRTAEIEKKLRMHKHWAWMDSRWEREPPVESITGRNSTAVLAAWNRLPNWDELDPQQFRARITWYFGIASIMPSIDSEILEKVIDAAGESLRLEGEPEPPTDAEAAAWPEIS